jgi:thioredoxin-related protein
MLLSLLILISSLQSEVLEDGCWTSDYAVARERARVSEKSLLLVFTGSDWCRSCMKLEKEVLQTDAFMNYVGEHFIAYRVDLPRNKKALDQETRALHEELLQQHNPKGSFPWMVLMEGDHVIWSCGYLEGGPEVYLKQWNAIP